MSQSKSKTTKLGPAAQKIADGLNDVIEGRYQTTTGTGYRPAEDIARDLTAEPVLTLRQFLRVVADHPAKTDTRLSADTLRLIFADLAEHADVLHKGLNHE